MAELQANQDLVRGFFKSVSTMDWKVGEIQIAHKMKSSYAFWNIETLCESSDFKFSHSTVFDKALFPAYKNRKIAGKSFPVNDAKVYIYRKEP